MCGKCLEQRPGTQKNRSLPETKPLGLSPCSSYQWLIGHQCCGMIATQADFFFFPPRGKNEAGSERIRANRKKMSKQAAMWSDSPAVLARRRTFVSLSLQHRRTAPFIKHFLSVQTWNKYLLPFIMRLYYYSHRCFSCNYYMGQHYHHLHFIGEETEVSRA